MTRAHEQLYLRTLHGLVAAGIDFCVLGTFGLRWQCPGLGRRYVGDCDIMLPSHPAGLAALVRHLQAENWRLTLWEQPVSLPLTAELLAGKYYLRARRAGAVLDCAYENDRQDWEAFVAQRHWHQGLPVLAAEHILAHKSQCHRPADQRGWQQCLAAVASQRAAANPVSPQGAHSLRPATLGGYGFLGHCC